MADLFSSIFYSSYKLDIYEIFKLKLCGKRHAQIKFHLYWHYAKITLDKIWIH